MISVDAALRELIGEEVRKALREMVGAAPDDDEYLSVARAAKIADVSPSFIRSQVSAGRLTKCRAGRELRIARAELDALLRRDPARREATPEELARASVVPLKRGAR